MCFGGLLCHSIPGQFVSLSLPSLAQQSHTSVMGFCIAGLQSEPDSRVVAGIELESAKPACNLSSQLSNQVRICMSAFARKLYRAA